MNGLAYMGGLLRAQGWLQSIDAWARGGAGGGAAGRGGAGEVVSLRQKMSGAVRPVYGGGGLMVVVMTMMMTVVVVVVVVLGYIISSQPNDTKVYRARGLEEVCRGRELAGPQAPR